MPCEEHLALTHLHGDTETSGNSLHGDTETSVNSLHGDTETSVNSLHGDTETSVNSLHGDTETSVNRLYGDTETSVNSLHGDTETSVNNLHSDTETSVIIRNYISTQSTGLRLCSTVHAPQCLEKLFSSCMQCRHVIYINGSNLKMVYNLNTITVYILNISALFIAVTKFYHSRSIQVTITMFRQPTVAEQSVSLVSS